MSGTTEAYTFVQFPGAAIGHLLRASDSAMIPCDLSNPDYHAFLAWLAEGNPAPAGWTGPQT